MADETKGTLVPIGGAEDKLRDPQILARFVELCEGGKIAIIPTASRLEDTGPLYEELFVSLGARAPESLKITERADCESEQTLDVLREADGVFMTGGNQLRLATTLGGTPAADLLRSRLREEGLHIAGTSAGAAIMSEHMIAGGDEGPTPHAAIVTLAPGLGLTRRVIVDQHFRQRDRLGRLLGALSYNPRLLGVGLDEDTAAFLGPDSRIEVVGSGAITILDASEVEHSSRDSAEGNDPIAFVGAKLHVLIDGWTFDLNQRVAYPPEKPR